jgi:hypothetical protein
MTFQNLLFLKDKMPRKKFIVPIGYEKKVFEARKDKYPFYHFLEPIPLNSPQYQPLACYCSLCRDHRKRYHPFILKRRNK